MSKSKDKALDFFQKASASNFEEKFEVTESSKTKNFRAEFIAGPLTEEEDSQIQLILKEEYDTKIAPETVTSDHQNLVQITSEIKSIDMQSQLLHGERISKAREILTKYNDGAYSRWLFLTYGNRQTPTRFLKYYEFFHSLTGEVKQLMQSMPKKAAYVLASREGDQEKKIEIIRNHHDDQPENIIKLVQEIFPLDEKDKRKRKPHDEVLADAIHANLKKLLHRKKNLYHATLSRVMECRELIEQILAAEE